MLPRKRGRIPTVQEKLTEAEGYYDILCTQVQVRGKCVCVRVRACACDLFVHLALLSPQSILAKLDSTVEETSRIKQTGNVCVPCPFFYYNSFLSIGNSLKKQKSLYKVLTPSIKPPYKFLWAYGSS